jgi:glycogen operon protein
MLRAGDELSHTQHGNNNAYCQDSKISWIDWELSDEKLEFLDFVRRTIRLWRDQPVLQRRKFFQGRAIRGSDVKDIAWFEPSGREMDDEAWGAEFARCFGMRLSGSTLEEVDSRGRHIQGDSLLVLLNAHHEAIPFTLPPARSDSGWERVLDTALPEARPEFFAGGAPYALEGRSLVILRLPMRLRTGKGTEIQG